MSPFGWRLFDGEKSASWLHLPSGEQFGNLSPAVSQQAVSLVDDEVLLGRPRGFLHIGIEVVVPSLSALLPQSALQLLGDHRPLLVAVEIDELYHLRDKGVS